MQNFRNLEVWERAHVLTLDVYQASKSFPRGGNVRIDQPDAKSVSIDRCQHCGGSCRRGDIDFARFLQMAAGSASELEYHLLLARDLKLLADAGLSAPLRPSRGGETNAHVSHAKAES